MPDEERTLGLSKERAELISTIILSVAAIMIAWTSFQAAKWGGVQAVAFSEAGAARVESTRADTRAGQLLQVDIALFVDWVAAIRGELDEGLAVVDSDGRFVEIDGTLSNFLYDRMRDEFRPALEAWLAEDPLDSPDAPKSPFEMEAYVLEASVQADALRVEAEDRAAEARQANQTGDTYVLTTVLFAAVLFFAGVASKLERQWTRSLALLVAIIFVAVGWITLASLPVELGDELFFLR